MPPAGAAISAQQAESIALGFAANHGFGGAYVKKVKDLGDRWEIRVRAPGGPGHSERRMTVWVDRAGHVPAYGEHQPGRPEWNDE
jgi:hypothetical protein